MKLIPEWKQAWKMHSVQIPLLMFALATIWTGLSLEEQHLILNLIPEAYRPLLVQGLGLLAIYARLRDQGVNK